jgi:hypothetical protein
MKLFRKGFEYNKLATSLNSLCIMLNEIDVKYKNAISGDYSDFEQDLYVIAYVSRRDILERIETFNWPIMSPIVVPVLSKGTVSLNFAIEQTIGRLQNYATRLNISELVTEILEKGPSYYELEAALPNNF